MSARLTTLPTVRLTDPQMQRFVDALRSWIDTRSGATDPLERAVTVRDLADLGLIEARLRGRSGSRGSSTSTQPTVLVQTPTGSLPMTFDAFAQSIYNTALFQDLMKRLDDPTRFDRLPQEVKAILLRDIADEAASRGADIRRLERKLQDTDQSLALKVEEVTAAVDGAMAGVRETVYAYAADGQAQAGKITQLQARVDGVPIDAADINSTVHATLAALQAAVPVGVRGVYYQVDDLTSTDNLLYAWNGTAYYLAGKGTHTLGGTATLEQSMTVSASRDKGLESQYTLKVQAGNKVAGYGIAATQGTDGAAESAFIVLADKFAVVGAGDSIPDPLNPTAARIPFGVDTVNNTVYINGNVRIDTGTGPRLSDIGAGEANIIVFAYRRSATTLTASDKPSADATFNFSTKALTGLNNSWTATIPAGTNPLYVISATASSTGTTDTIVTADWTTPVVLAQNGEAASAGANSAVAYLYRRTTTGTAPSTPTGTSPTNDLTYTFSTGGLAGTPPADWSITIPPTGGDYLWESRAVAFATGGTDVILPTEWSVARLFSQNGAIGGSGKSTYLASVYTRFATAPAAPVNSTGSFNFGTNTLTVPTSAAPGSYTWSANIPAGASPAYVSTFLFSITGDTGSVTAGAWSTPVKLVENGTPGESGVSTYLYPVYIRATSSPSTPSGGQYDFGNNIGTPPSGWSNAPPAGLNQLFMSTALASVSGATGIDTVLSWSAPQPVANRGSLTGNSQVTSPALYSTAPWNGTTDDNLASQIIWVMLGNSAGSYVAGTRTHLVPGDTVTLRNSAGTDAETRTWNSSAWGATGVVIDGNLIVNGTIGASALKADAIDGKTITGATVRTAASGARIEMSAATNLMRGYDAANALKFYVDMTNGNMTLNGWAPVLAVASISSSGGGDAIYGNNTSTGTGVRGNATGAGAGVYGTSTSGYGGRFSSILCEGVFASTRASGDAITVGRPIASNLLTGTAPLFVSSTTLCTNLNADFLDNQHGTYFLDCANFTGTLADARIPGLAASKITSGTFDAARVPNLDAAKITTGTFAAARVPFASPGAIGSTTPNTGAFTTLSTTGLASLADIRINKATTIGGAAANNSVGGAALVSKPGVASNNVWLAININGTTYYIPVWT
jgi:hypothetical protein